MTKVPSESDVHPGGFWAVTAAAAARVARAIAYFMVVVREERMEECDYRGISATGIVTDVAKGSE